MSESTPIKVRRYLGRREIASTMRSRLVWVPLHRRMDAAIADRVCAAIDRELAAWNGTPYMPGQKARGAGADCRGFAAGFLDAMTGTDGVDLKKIPPDSGMSNPALADEIVRAFESAYMCARVTDGRVEPGDVLVLNCARSMDASLDYGGPQHALVVGTDGRFAWHASRTRVKRIGFAFDRRSMRLGVVFRPSEKEKWADRHG